MQMLLEAQNITYRPSRAWTLLDGVGLGIRPGEIATIYGENGCGKTTLLHILAGLIRPHGGEVYFANGSESEARRVTRWPLWRRARLGMAYLPQQNRIWPDLPLRDHWTLGEGNGRAGADAKRAERIESILGRLPKVAKAGELSHGQQRLLLLCRYLMQSPKVLLADEPTAGLDKATQELAVELIGSMIADGMAAIVVEHDREALKRLGGRTMLLHEGKLRDV
jgi:ABC-type branched-subunit amino acid transport system ATPase component